MTPLAALAAGLATLAAVIFSIWTYRRREVKVPGRAILVSLRAAALALTALLLVNPRVPGWGGGQRDAGEWLLVDASLSMSAGPDGSTPWDAAQAVDGADGGPIILFGQGARAVDGPLQDARPTQPYSRLAGAVRLAAEGGAPSVRIVSDFRVTDLTEALALVDLSGLTAELTPVDSDFDNVGVAEIRLPGFIATDDTASVEVSVFASGLDRGDSVRITVWDEGIQVAAVAIPAPGAGALRRVRIPLPPPAGDGELHRYRVEAEAPGDGFAEDDERVAYVRTDRRQGGLVLVSRSPDWEPRFLLPALSEITGLEPEGFLDVSDGRYLRMLEDAGPAGSVDSATVRRRAASADLLVLHGVTADDPWTRGVAASSSRLVFLPTSAAGAAVIGLTTGRPVPGEWYLDASVPASPVAAGLTGFDPEGLPPVGPVLPIAGTPGWSAAINAGRSAGGPREAVLAVSTVGDRRRVAVLATGLWRWAFRGGAELNAYRRLWSAVGGWLVAGEATVLAADVQPEVRVVPRGQAVAWSAAGHAGEQLRFQVLSGEDVVDDTVMAIGPTETARSAPLPPGEYQYRVSSAGAGEELGQGRFDVERFVPELRWPVADPAAVVRTAGVTGSTRVGGRRLRTSPLPYLLLMAVLSAEWYLRRERGLR